MDTSSIINNFRPDSYGKISRPISKIKALLQDCNKERDLTCQHYGRWLVVNCTLNYATGLWIFEHEIKEYTDQEILNKYKSIHNIKP
jgi:hypothetical protein